MYTKVLGTNGLVVNTTSKANGDWQRDLSPFHVGPCPLYDGKVSLNMENAWQFAKVYAQHADQNGDPTPAYWVWAEKGWGDQFAHRYPMGRGAVPKYSWWEGNKLGYIDARKQIYAPLYAEAVKKTNGWNRLVQAYNTEPLIVLRDFDGYDYGAMNKTLTQVLNDPKRKMGHAFVLAMLLTGDAALNQMTLR
jgi:hypothetical protein